MSEAMPPAAPRRAGPHGGRASLERIAAALDCPVSALLTGEGMPSDLADRIEILRLWDALRTDDSRQAVLKLVWAMVDAQ